MSERARVRRHYATLCVTLIAAVSGSICIARINPIYIYIYVDVCIYRYIDI